MQLFLDTANIDEIREAASWGVISGVTTNPSLIAKEGVTSGRLLRDLGSRPGPISAEVLSEKAEDMIPGPGTSRRSLRTSSSRSR